MAALPARKQQLVEAAIYEIGTSGSLSVTVGQIAKRAGVSAALAFHYFGDKDRLFLATMRYILKIYGDEARRALLAAQSPRERVEGVIRSCFTPANFRAEVVATWLNFYVMAQQSAEARRLLSIYHRRLKSNLTRDLRPLAGERASDIALRIAGLIDGIYFRSALNPNETTSQQASSHVLTLLDNELEALS